MPGKVNPVIPEAVSQVVAQVYGNDTAVAFAGSQGNFELNVFLPVIARNVLESIHLLANVSRLFADRCLAGLEPDVERCRAYAEATPQAAAALNRLLGYDKVAELVKESTDSGRSIRSLVLEQGLPPRGRARRGPRPPAPDPRRLSLQPAAGEPAKGVGSPASGMSGALQALLTREALGDVAPLERVPALGGADDLAVAADVDEGGELVEAEGLARPPGRGRRR